MQVLVVVLLVVASFAYAVGSLMPGKLQRLLRTRLSRLPVLGRWVPGVADSGCAGGCKACSATSARPLDGAQPGVQPLIFHKRKR